MARLLPWGGWAALVTLVFLASDRQSSLVYYGAGMAITIAWSWCYYLLGAFTHARWVKRWEFFPALPAKDFLVYTSVVYSRASACADQSAEVSYGEQEAALWGDGSLEQFHLFGFALPEFAEAFRSANAAKVVSLPFGHRKASRTGWIPLPPDWNAR